MSPFCFDPLDFWAAVGLFGFTFNPTSFDELSWSQSVSGCTHEDSEQIFRLKHGFQNQEFHTQE